MSIVDYLGMVACTRGGVMNETEIRLLRDEICRLRNAYKTQRLLLLASLAAVTVFAITFFGGPLPVAAQSATPLTPDKDGVLHVRGLVVEDQGGHERLRLGAPLPDPMIHGVRHKRQGPVSGLLIADPDGNERGGYVTTDTSGEALISLDSEDEQEVMLLTNPKGGANFYLRDKSNMVQMTVFAGETYGSVQVPDGPKFTMSKGKQNLLELPAAPK
jgi:hypothetical protein